MKYITLALITTILCSACIGDDFIDDRVEPVLRLANQIDSLAVGSEFQFEATFFNNVGREEPNEIVWSSNNEDIISITPSGLASALNPGTAEIVASTQSSEGEINITFLVEAGARTVEVETTSRSGVIQTTTFYDLEGDFTLSTNDDGSLLLDVADNYLASSTLPGLYLYLTNNPRSIAGAFEVGRVTVFRGAHSFTIEGVDINEYNYLLYFCKPFNVKVGDAEIE